MPLKKRLPLVFMPLLAACQPVPVSTSMPVEPSPKSATQQWQSTEQLEAATHTFLTQTASDKTAHDAQQRALASAWMQRSQQALEAGDVNAATAALMRARSLLPQAPALTNDFGSGLKPSR